MLLDKVAARPCGVRIHSAQISALLDKVAVLSSRRLALILFHIVIGKQEAEIAHMLLSSYCTSSSRFRLGVPQARFRARVTS